MLGPQLTASTCEFDFGPFLNLFPSRYKKYAPKHYDEGVDEIERTVVDIVIESRVEGDGQ